MLFYKYKNDLKTNREYFKCLKKAEYIHKRIKKLFDNLPTVYYLKSGIKGESYIKNAQKHAHNNYFFLLDIRNFFPSITKKYIKKELMNTYKQSSNVAEFISNALTAPQKKFDDKRALITGSPISQYFSYVINKRMFEELNVLAQKQGITFTVYVDDISFSANFPIGHAFLKKVFYVIKSNGFELSKNKKDKKKFYRGKIGNNSIVTGILIQENGLFISKQREKKIEGNITILKSMSIQDKVFEKLYLSTKSSIHQAVLVNEKYKSYLNQIEKIKTL